MPTVRCYCSKLAFPGALVLTLLLSGSALAQIAPDRSLVPASIRDPILLEYSGELAYGHVQLLALNRMRSVEEYAQTYLETTYMEEMATRYGLSDVRVDYFPSRDAWVPEVGDLWLVEPVQKKLASLTMVPAALAAGSASGNVEAEVIYVGAGREADYAGKDVEGKIVLGNASVGQVFSSAVGRHGAAGALGTGSAGVSRDNAGYSLDQIGWQSVGPVEGGGGFGFVLSLRQFTELRNYLERGERVVVRANVRTGSVPGRMNVVSAAIAGTDPDAGELMIVSHLFERPPTPGASDNSTGVAVTLEIGRTLAELIRRGELPQPKRTIRFLWVPEISGSRAFMYQNPELEDRIIAAMNYDMPGEDLEETDSYLRMKMTPDSRPSYLNDLIANLLQFVDQTEIRTQTGNNAPFNYRLVPFISGSDHIVFLDAGIPAMQFNHWPDNFYHSSGDVAERTDPTEMKRVGFMGAASFYYLASAGPDEAMDLAWEAAANGEKWMAEVTRQSARLLDVEESMVHHRFGAALNKVYGALQRSVGGVTSVLDLSETPEVREQVSALNSQLAAVHEVQVEKLASLYRSRCQEFGVRPQTLSQTDEERRYDGMVPRKLFGFYTEEYQAASSRFRQFFPAGLSLPRLASTEIAWFVDGRRSIAEIWRLVRAEYGNVTTSNDPWKFAYVVTPQTQDIDLATVAAYVEAMEQAGMVEIMRR
ncbi:M28 family peptidase [Gemmatimonadota bacterium]